MSQKLIFLIFLIFIFQHINAENEDELFGDKSIIRKLRDSLGSFKAEIKMKDALNKIYPVKDQYNFKSKSGQVQNLITINQTWTYLDEFSEFFDAYENEKCYTIMNDQLMMSYLKIFFPPTSIQIPSKFKMLGPSLHLFSLIDNYDQNKENVKCENLSNDKIRCDILFDKESSFSSKIEYYFENRNNLKMYPIKTKSFMKFIGKFYLYREMEYTKFDYSFNGDNYQIDSKFPIGIGCERSNKNNKHPEIGTNLGKKFKLEYDAELEYLDLETKYKNVFLKTQFKSQEWSMSNNFSFNIFDSIDGKANKSIRTYLVDKIKSVHEIHNDKCIEYNLETGENAKWINQLHNIENFPEFFFTGSKYYISYLGDHELAGKIHRVFEKTQYNAPKKDEQDEDRQPRTNVVTHYYSESDNKIPKLIEIRTRALLGKLLAILRIKVNKHTLLSESDNFNEIKLNQCSKN